jgi:hypothetical protein
MRAIVIAASFLALTSVSAAAQQLNQPACPGGSLCPQQSAPPSAANKAAAPVGHRQPTMNGLTPQVRHEETTGSGAADPLGPLPRICRAC